MATPLYAESANTVSKVTSILQTAGAAQVPQSSSIIYVWGGVEIDAGQNKVGAYIWGSVEVEATVDTVGINVSASNTGVYAVGLQFGFYGIALQKDGAAVCGSGGAKALAGWFTGPVLIDGDRSDLQMKASRARGAPVTLRFSANLDNRVEYFDTATITHNHPSVAIPYRDDFMALVDTKECMIFLTPTKDCQGLYISKQEDDKFTVSLHGGGVANDIDFAYHVVGPRACVVRPSAALGVEAGAVRTQAGNAKARIRGKKRAKVRP